MSRLSIGSSFIAALWLCTGCGFSQRKACDPVTLPCTVGTCQNGVCVIDEATAANGGKGGRRATPTGNSETTGEKGGSGADTGTTSNPSMMTPGQGGAGGARMTSTTTGGRGGSTATMTQPAMMGECKAGDAARSCNFSPGCDGMQRCNGTMWGECEPPADRLGMPETCNGIDDNCNGMVDENIQAQCYPPSTAGCTKNADGKYTCKGICNFGTQDCVNGKLSDTCNGAKTPEAMDVCQAPGTPALDEDCDGTADNGCNCTVDMPCHSGPTSTQNIGECKDGKLLCTGGKLQSVCMGEVLPGIELCNGKDDDCNGMTDDVIGLGLPCSVPNATGVCMSGTAKCGANMIECVSLNAPSVEVCNGKDDDCNGMTDDIADAQTNAMHCGGCNKPACTAPANTCCAGGCVDLQSDKKNCGMCGKTCAAMDTCTAGACKPPMTMAGAGTSGGAGATGGTTAAAGHTGMAGASGAPTD